MLSNEPLFEPRSHGSIGGLLLAGLWPALLAAAPLGKEKLPQTRGHRGPGGFPSVLKLHHRYEYTQLLLTARLAGGEQVDVTRRPMSSGPQTW